jgi:hypothetical protein
MSRAYECHCICHGENGEIIANHCVPCCSECPHCGERIVMGFMESHIKESHPANDASGTRSTFMRRFESKLV